MSAPKELFANLNDDQLTEVWHFLNACKGRTARSETRRTDIVAWISRTVMHRSAQPTDGDSDYVARNKTIRRIRAGAHALRLDPLQVGLIVHGATMLHTSTLENCDTGQLCKVEQLLDDVIAGRRTLEEIRAAVEQLRHNSMDSR